MKRRFFSLAFILVFAFSAFAQIPTGYYTNAEGKTGATLKTALYNIISSHTDVGYDGLYNVYKTSDNLPSGKVWDMYSLKADGTANYFYSHTSSDQCGSYSSESDCYNREHTFCDSWLGKASPQRSDAHHIVPTDGYVNNRRSSYPHGKVGTASWTSSNGSKLGNSDASTGYSGVVFEPIDEFKGDFARMYFYVVTCYENKVAGWASNGSAGEILDGTSYPAFKTWFKSLMLQWNAQDPVSQKEIDRNNAIYTFQHNRNPFIDHPEYAESIWGTGTIALNFTSSAVTSATVNQAYSYAVSVTGPTGSTFTITAPTKPDWLTLTPTGSKTASLSGTPTTTGSFDVVLSVTDGTSTKTQSFTIVVAALEGLKFTSTPVITAISGSAYSYSITTSDLANPTSIISLTATTKPAWLTLTDNGNGTATLSGTPSASDAGSNSVTLKADDSFTPVTQTFTITVSLVGATNTETFTNAPDIKDTYSNTSWTGDGGSSWTATLARTDQPLNGKAICLKKDASAYVQSGTITGGCGSVSFKVKRGFTTVETGTITLFINSNQVGQPFTYNETEQTATFSNINIAGNFVIKLLNNGGARPVINDVSWTNYTPVPNVLPTITNILSNPSNPLTNQDVTVSATITDSDGTIQEAYLMWETSSGGLTNKVSMTLNGGNYEGTIPAQTSAGIVYYTVNAKDNSGDTKTSDVNNISIAAPNIPPSISDISINPLTPLTGQDVTISATISDSDGVIEDAWLRWGTSSSALTNQLTMSMLDNKYQAIIPAQTQSGTIYTAIYSRDDSGDETSSTYSFEVIAPNVLPNISNISINPANPLTNQAVIVSATITDSDGSIQDTYIMWGTTSGSLTNKVSMALNSGSYEGTILAQSVAGTIYYTVSAKDNSGDTKTSDQQNFAVVAPNVLPSISGITINPTNPQTNQAVFVSALITDSDGTIQEAYIMWGTTSSSLTNKVGMVLNSGSFEGTIPAQSIEGTVYYTVNAKDNSGDLKTSNENSFEVTAPNVLPSISNISINPASPQTGHEITISATITDSDGTIQEAVLSWGDTQESLSNQLTMNLVSGSYEATIPSQSQTGTVYFSIYAKDNDNGESTQLSNFTVSPNTNVNNDEIISKLKIYPNPAKNQITIEINGFNANRIEISNIIGAKILSTSFFGSKQPIDISNLKAGIYFVTIYGSGQKETQRLVVY